MNGSTLTGKRENLPATVTANGPLQVRVCSQAIAPGGMLSLQANSHRSLQPNHTDTGVLGRVGRPYALSAPDVEVTKGR